MFQAQRLATECVTDLLIAGWRFRLVEHTSLFEILPPRSCAVGDEPPSVYDGLQMLSFLDLFLVTRGIEASCQLLREMLRELWFDPRCQRSEADPCYMVFSTSTS